jgi:hypothetical protein
MNCMCVLALKWFQSYQMTTYEPTCSKKNGTSVLPNLCRSRKLSISRILLIITYSMWYNLFNWSVSIWDCMMWNGRIISESCIGGDSEGSGHGLNLRYYPTIYAKELRKSTKTFSQDIRCLGQDWTQTLPPIQVRSFSPCAKLSGITH